jgi:O-antigen/teichoic acid export membrane protein
VWFGFWLTLYAVLDTFAVLLKFLLRAYERTEFDPIFTTIGRVLLLLPVLLLARAHELTLGRIAAIHVASAAIELIGLVIVVKMLLPIRFFARASWIGAKEVFKASVPFAVSNLAAFVYLKTGLIILSLVKGEDAAAYFGTAGRIPEAALFLPAALANAFIPFFSRNAHDIPLIRRYFAALIHVAAFAAVCLAGLFVFETDFIIRLVSKKEYLVARDAFQLYGAWIFFAFLQVMISNLLVCLNAERAMMWRYVVSLGINLTLNSILIPFFGITGAAVALVLSEVISTAYNYLLLKKQDVSMPRSLLPESALLFCFFALSLLLPEMPAPVRVVCCSVVAAAAAAGILHYHYPGFVQKLVSR